MAEPPPPQVSQNEADPVHESDVARLPDAVHHMEEPPSPPVLLEVTRLSMSILAPLCVTHEPSRRRKNSLKYWYLHAAGDGCQHCVKILVKDMSVDKHARSDTQGWSAMDFADYFQTT